MRATTDLVADKSTGLSVFFVAVIQFVLLVLEACVSLYEILNRLNSKKK